MNLKRYFRDKIHRIDAMHENIMVLVVQKVILKQLNLQRKIILKL